MMKEIRAEIVIIRVISMSMIVLCHVIRYYSFVPGSKILGQVFNVGVEVFFAVSGFLYGKKTIYDFGKWFRNRAKRLWIPEIILSTIILITGRIFGFCNANSNTVIAYLLNMQGLLFINASIFGSLFSSIDILDPLWFMTVIMFCYCLIPYAQKIRSYFSDRENKTYIYFGGLTVLLVISFFAQLFFKTTTIYFLVFLSGYFLAELEIDKKKYSTKRVIALTGIIIFFMAARVGLHRIMDGTDLYACLSLLGHAVIGICLMYLGIELGKRFTKVYAIIAKKKTVRLLNDASLYIYMVHGIFCMGSALNVFLRFSLPIATLAFIALTLLGTKVLWFLTDGVNRLLG